MTIKKCVLYTEVQLFISPAKKKLSSKLMSHLIVQMASQDTVINWFFFYFTSKFLVTPKKQSVKAHATALQKKKHPRTRFRTPSVSPLEVKSSACALDFPTGDPLQCLHFCTQIVFVFFRFSMLSTGIFSCETWFLVSFEAMDQILPKKAHAWK